MMIAKILIFVTALVTYAGAENQYDARNRLKLMHLRRNMPLITASAESTCGCTTIYSTSTGEGVLLFPPTPTTFTELNPQPTSEITPIIDDICPPPSTVSVTVTVTEKIEIGTTLYPSMTLGPSPIPIPVPADSTEPDVVHSSDKPESPVITIPDLHLPSPPSPTPTAQIPELPNTDSLGSKNGMWAITFSLFNDDGKCKSVSTVWAEVNMIRAVGFKSIRVYGTECDGIENISTATSFHGMKLILGVFIGETGCSGAREQVNHIVKWGRWDLVELVVIGNEALFSGHASPGELANFITWTKTILRSAGYNGPCTTAEPLNMWEQNSGTLCDVVDVVGCNIHPFFNPEVDASHAGLFVKSQLEIVERLCPGKRGINLECGWPSAGECNGKACPGMSEQETAVSSIQTFAGNMSVMFTFSNDKWKRPGAFHVEQSFGLIRLLTSH
ncbi:putative beta-glucosidase btgE [Erysiphe neolycopersici]|uniref:Probable beta-glucosidase btgE n=1 Tax=Erysiphe neolycopersici TaxID=212602 RepID=A0A420I6I0_9PEZI|nr:putative beta-glucosidase btgE [Erysiphe neolycopersici]